MQPVFLKHFFVFLLASGFAMDDLSAQQVPQAIQYQAILRNTDGTALMNKPVQVRFSIRSTSPTGNVAYREQHNVFTNGQGLVNLVIGFGNVQSGSMQGVDWASVPHFLQVEADTGTGWVDLGTTQFLSVPFALVAGKVLGGSGAPASNEIRDANQTTGINCELYPDEDIIRVKVDGQEQWQFEGPRLMPRNNAHCIFIGEETGKSNQPFGDKDNTFIGHSAGRDNQAGFGNTFLGAYAGQLSLSEDNTFIGANAGRVNQTGYVNTFVGEAAGFGNKTGAANTFVGQVAGFMCDNGAYNTFIGRGAGHDNVSGHHNVYLGRSAGFRNVTGAHNIYIGNLAGLKETSGDYKLFIDSDTTSAAPLIFGDFATRRVGINRKAATNALEVQGSASKASPGEWLGNSDRRLKKNIQPLDSRSALQKLLALRGVTFEWNDEKTGTERPSGQQMGFVAQEIQSVFPEMVSQDADGFLQAAYGTFDPLTVEAIREMNRRVEALENENKMLREKLDEIEFLKKELQKLSGK